ncbi:hypothetical protein [Streptococcus gallolyticus]|uniref:hypothetical protein n=1 Tax=Streptococcus gallolyticus TaxID=315405 RepID=UPI00088243A5|nr:hypothetical protein [Streptococcus gallolyticus]SDJ64207.1 UDP:flavonoid glycosyltransferase YjiC, YdhE family [Streptococcus gallolyticus]SDL12949.1 UDP:flavonoid glycosyltransferase YjiC, YdhE family [Streptococcus gallolyticus]
MKRVVLAPNPTGTGHNVRMLNIGNQLLQSDKELELTVLLGSRQDVFADLFKKLGIDVIDLSPSGVVDSSKKSHLSTELNWKTMISNYFVPTFFNGDKILKYIGLISKCSADVVISDYNINATIAAIILGKKNIFVTERHNFTLVDISLSDLKKAGFDIDDTEIAEAKKYLEKVFEWILKNIDLLITDKVIIPDFLDRLNGDDPKIHFVGSMYRQREGKNLINFNYSQDYIVATSTNTTMLEKDSLLAINTYISAFEKLSKKHPNLKLLLIGDVPNVVEIDNHLNIEVLSYVPNWEELIKHAKLVWSHPGWISVTELAYLDIKSVFYLPSFMEYHEVEAFNRLQFLGLPTISGEDSEGLSDVTSKILNGDLDTSFEAYRILNPSKDGLKRGVDKILSIIESEV